MSSGHIIFLYHKDDIKLMIAPHMTGRQGDNLSLTKISYWTKYIYIRHSLIHELIFKYVINSLTKGYLEHNI